MLRPERRADPDDGEDDEDDGPGRFNPRNDGPLIIGPESSGSGSSGIAAGATYEPDDGLAGGTVVRTGGTGAETEVDVAVEPAVRVALTGAGAGAGSRVVPHIPQNRLVAGFSLPQRGQRTFPPAHSLRYLCSWMQRDCSRCLRNEHLSGNLFCTFAGRFSKPKR